MAVKKKPVKKVVVEKDNTKEISLFTYIILAPLLFIVMIVGTSFLVATWKSGQMPDGEVIVTLFRTIVEMLAQYHAPPPSTPPPTN